MIHFSNLINKKIKKQLYWRFVERKNFYKLSQYYLHLRVKKSLSKTYVDTIGIKKKVISYGILDPKINSSVSKNLFFKKFSYLKNTDYFLYLGRFNEKKVAKY